MREIKQKPDRNSERAGEVTVLLKEAREGNASALAELVPLVYSELKAIAANLIRREYGPRELEPTALVHEVYSRLIPLPDCPLRDRTHFLAVAARAMRQVLIDEARRRNAEKRGGDWGQTTLTGKELGFNVQLEEMLTLDDALKRLTEMDQRLGQIVEYRFFAGMAEDEIAALLGVSAKTVQREWTRARAWLYKELYV